MPPLSRFLGARLHEFREQRDLKVTEVAALIGVQRTTVYGIEKGDAYPSFDTLQNLCRVYRKEPVDCLIFPEKGVRHRLYELIRLASDDALVEIEAILASRGFTLDQARQPSKSASQPAPKTRKRASSE
jgi:transcriptional regulator with XRE-family HTH domain